MKKINIGIVLMIVTIISFIICINIINVFKQKEIDKARKFVDEFVMFSNKYTLLPEKYRDINVIMPKEEFDEYILEMRNELGKYILDTQQEVILKTFEDNLREQYKGMFVYEKNDLQIKYNGDKIYGRMVDDIIIIIHTQEYKIIADRREGMAKDITTGRYIGNIKHAEGVQSIPATTMVKKMENGEYKVCFYVEYFTIPFLFENEYGPYA